jgi:hypothetical protein
LIEEDTSRADYDYDLELVSGGGLIYEIEQVHLFRGNVDLRVNTSDFTCHGDPDAATNKCKIEVTGLS